MTTPLISRYRGDTVPDAFTIVKPDGSPQDLTNYSFTLTVSADKDPANTSAQLFQVLGVIVNAATGSVEFTPNSTQTDVTPGRYYFDVQAITPTGLKHTIYKGVYRIHQDITKS